MRSQSVRIFVLVLLIQCIGIFDHSLWTPDEPREAEIVREMSISGDYLIPHFAGMPFLEKPPLYYTVSVIAYKVFGSFSPEAGRIASLLFALAALLIVYSTAQRIYSDEASALATLVLSTFPLFFLVSHKMLVDVGLVFFITAAMCSFLLAYKGLFPAGMKIFWVSVALAFMTKGIIGLALPGAGVCLFLLWQKDMGFIKKAWVIQGSLLVLGVMLVWGWILFLKGGEDFLYKFYVYNQIGRFIPNETIYHGGHVRPFYFYFKDVPVQTLPWSILLIPALAITRPIKDTERFLFSWLLGGLLVLSIASTKREIYFLPMYPALAIIIGQWMASFSPNQSRKWEAALLWCALILGLLVLLALPIGYVKLGGAIWVAAGISILLAGIFRSLWRKYRNNLPFYAVMGWSLMFIVWAPFLFPQVDRSKSYEQLFTDYGKIVLHRQVIGYQLTETVQALGPFYGGFPVLNIEDREQFREAVKAKKAEFIIALPSRMDEELYRELASMAAPVHKGSGGTRRETQLWMMHSFP